MFLYKATAPSNMRIFAVFECVSWVLLLVAIFFKYAAFLPEALRTAGTLAVAFAGALHGVVTIFYIFFCFVGFWTCSQVLRLKLWVLCLLSAVVPFASILFDRKYSSRAEADSPLSAWLARRPIFVWSVFASMFVVVLSVALVRVGHV